ncbi:MAG: NTP transferase domain-containing protein [Anaerolineae bacterium]
MKPFPKAKSRLSGVLTTEQREALAERFFRHTLNILSQVKEITNILVISRDPQVLSLAREYHAVTVQESGAPELNAALMRAAQVAGLKGAEAILILPADLPLLTAHDVREILHLGRYNQTVVLAPDRQGMVPTPCWSCRRG